MMKTRLVMFLETQTWDGKSKAQAAAVVREQRRQI